MKRMLPLAILVLFGLAGRAHADNVMITAGSLPLEELSFNAPDIRFGVGGTDFSVGERGSALNNDIHQGGSASRINAKLATIFSGGGTLFLALEQSGVQGFTGFRISGSQSVSQQSESPPGSLLPQTMPEPTTLLLMGTGLVGAAYLIRRWRL